MTISNLTNFMKNHQVNVVQWPVSELELNRVAVDANNLCCNRFFKVKKDVMKNWPLHQSYPQDRDFTQPLIDSVVRFVIRLLHHRCVPILVFDGQSPKEKAATVAKRVGKYQKKREELAELRAQLDRMYAENVLPDDNLIARFSKLMIDTKMPNPDMYKEIKLALTHLGIPVMTAIGEGDALCASLVIDGHCVAAMGSDRDILVYGCPILIGTFFISKDGMLDKVYYLQGILNDLDLSFDEFVSLCIMCGCDYNTNIPRIGSERAYKHIQDGRHPTELDNSEVLNFDKCRSIFTYRPSEELIDEEAPLDLGEPYVEDDTYIEKYFLQEYVEQIQSARKNIDRINTYEPVPPKL